MLNASRKFGARMLLSGGTSGMGLATARPLIATASRRTATSTSHQDPPFKAAAKRSASTSAKAHANGQTWKNGHVFKRKQAEPTTPRVEQVKKETPETPFDQEKFIEGSKEMRMRHLEDQAMYALKISCENYGNAVFPNAMIAGDVVITHLLHRLGYIQDGRCKIMVVDTFHLFPETMQFLDEIEKYYGFKAEVFCAAGIPVGDKAGYDAKYGADLWKEDIEHYDKVCKIEPFQRGLKTLKANCMINGRTRWQGFERAWVNQFENAPIGGGLAKCNPLAYWTLEDVFDYIAMYKVPHHPLHAKGYPSIGDAKDTIPIPEDGSVKFANFKFEGDKAKWLDYATERKGRFVGLAKKDGSLKTECGIHVAGAETTFERDLWINGSKVKGVTCPKEMTKVTKSGKPSVIAVYAPWCQNCQDMEDEFEKFATQADIDTFKFRGDEERNFVSSTLNTESFPTINVVHTDGTVVKYQSEIRTAEALNAFVSEQLSSKKACKNFSLGY